MLNGYKILYIPIKSTVTHSIVADATSRVGRPRTTKTQTSTQRLWRKTLRSATMELHTRALKLLFSNGGMESAGESVSGPGDRDPPPAIPRSTRWALPWLPRKGARLGMSRSLSSTEDLSLCCHCAGVGT